MYTNNILPWSLKVSQYSGLRWNRILSRTNIYVYFNQMFLSAVKFLCDFRRQIHTFLKTTGRVCQTRGTGLILGNPWPQRQAGVFPVLLLVLGSYNPSFDSSPELSLLFQQLPLSIPFLSTGLPCRPSLKGPPGSSLSTAIFLQQLLLSCLLPWCAQHL